MAALNPIKVARQREGFSQEDLARATDIHPQAVLLNEAGCYPGILPKIEYWLQKKGYSVGEARIAYRDFISKKRAALQGTFDITLNWSEFTLDTHPFIKFRTLLQLSRGGFAKKFCVQPAFLYKLERGEAQALSAQLKEALFAVGFPPEFIDELNERCIEFATLPRLRPSLTGEASGG